MIDELWLNQTETIAFYVLDANVVVKTWSAMSIVVDWTSTAWSILQVWIILDIMRKPNPLIVLLYIKNSHTKIDPSN